MNKGQEIKEVIANFFMKVCSKERYIEVRRQLLCDKNDFEPYVAFNRLARACNESSGITGKSIVAFLEESVIKVDLKETKALLHHYDSDTDDVLSYKEFLDIVLPKEHPDLRAFVTQRECYEITHDEYLSYETEAALAMLLEREIKLFRDVMEDKMKLDQYGLSGYKIVEIIDGDGEGNLNYNNLRNFIHESGIIPYDAEIISFLRRVDRDDDGAINAKELEKFLSLFTFSQKNHQLEERNKMRHTKKADLKLKSPKRKIVNTKVSLLSHKKEIKPDMDEGKENVFKSNFKSKEGIPPLANYQEKKEVVDKREEAKELIRNKGYSYNSGRAVLTSSNYSNLKRESLDRREKEMKMNSTSSTHARSLINRSYRSRQNRESLDSHVLKKIDTNIGSNSLDQSAVNLYPAYDPRRESFGVHSIRRDQKTLKEPSLTQTVLPFDNNRDSFGVSIRKETSGLLSQENINKNYDNRESFGIGIRNPINVSYEQRKEVFGGVNRASLDNSGIDQNYSQKTNHMIQIGGKPPLAPGFVTPNTETPTGTIDMIATPHSYQKREVKIEQSPVKRILNEYSACTNTPIQTEKNFGYQKYQENIVKSIKKSGMKLSPRKSRDNQNLTISPVIERTSGYQFTNKNNSAIARSITPKKSPISSIKTPLKNMDNRGISGKKQRTSKKLKSALKTDPRQKYEKALSVRWADEQSASKRSQEEMFASRGRFGDTSEIGIETFQIHDEILPKAHTTTTTTITQNFDQNINIAKASIVVEAVDTSKKNHYLEQQSHQFGSMIPQRNSIPEPNYSTKARHFADNLKDILIEEAKLDQAKRDLFANPDFNVRKLFKMIDPQEKGFFTFDDLLFFFQKIGIINTDQDQDLLIDFFSFYDTKQCFQLDFEKLANMVYPYDRRIVREGHYNNKEFYRLTMRDIIAVFEKQLKGRLIISEVKRNLADKMIDLSSLFHELDYKKRGFLGKDEFVTLMKFSGGSKLDGINHEDIEFFMKKCDRDLNGKIDLKDFYLFFSN